MIIQSPLLTLGKDPEPKFTENGMMVRIPMAENQRRNMGTEDEPQWETINTSWFDMVAFGDVAREIMDNLKKGDAIKLERGYHQWKNIGSDLDPDYRAQYRIVKFKIIPKKNS